MIAGYVFALGEAKGGCIDQKIAHRMKTGYCGENVSVSEIIDEGGVCVVLMMCD